MVPGEDLVPAFGWGGRGAGDGEGGGDEELGGGLLHGRHVFGMLGKRLGRVCLWESCVIWEEVQGWFTEDNAHSRIALRILHIYSTETLGSDPLARIRASQVGDRTLTRYGIFDARCDGLSALGR